MLRGSSEIRPQPRPSLQNSLHLSRFFQGGSSGAGEAFRIAFSFLTGRGVLRHLGARNIEPVKSHINATEWNSHGGVGGDDIEGGRGDGGWQCVSSRIRGEPSGMGNIAAEIEDRQSATIRERISPINF